MDWKLILVGTIIILAALLICIFVNSMFKVLGEFAKGREENLAKQRKIGGK